MGYIFKAIKYYCNGMNGNVLILDNVLRHCFSTDDQVSKQSKTSPTVNIELTGGGSVDINRYALLWIINQLSTEFIQILT